MRRNANPNFAKKDHFYFNQVRLYVFGNLLCYKFDVSESKGKILIWSSDLKRISATGNIHEILTKICKRLNTAFQSNSF